jgi:hypothetical protein
VGIMSNRKINNEFGTPSNYKHQIDIWYRAHSINYEKIELFYDFLTSVYELVDSTFLGSDVTLSESDQRNHFDWCWGKTIQNFSLEKIHFKPTGAHHEYLWNFFLEAYYFSITNEEPIKIKEYLFKLFDFTHTKTRSELDMLAEVYKLLDQNLKK